MSGSIDQSKLNLANVSPLLGAGMGVSSLSRNLEQRKTPRPHQITAVRDLVAALGVPGEDRRAQFHSACGTGKTLSALWTSEELGLRTLLCAPTLNLVAQHVREWRASYTGARPKFLVVCSDETTIQSGPNELPVDLRDIEANVTSSPDEIARFLRNNGQRVVVVSTNHSLPLVESAQKDQALAPFDCAVIDEAHRTASPRDSLFALVHDNKKIRARTRLYMTGTPRIYGDGDATIFSMDDEKVFGKVAHRLSFGDAIKKGLLSDYQLVVATIPEKEAALWSAQGFKPAEVRSALAELAFLRAAQKYGLSKVMTFHSTVERARITAGHLADSSQKIQMSRDIWAQGIHGNLPSVTRSGLLSVFKEQDPHTLAVVANCRCLSEGVDIPALDGVVFFDPRGSYVEVAQAIGRVMRLSARKTVGTILVPVVVPENADAEEVLFGSEFKKVAKVILALRSHDERFEASTKRHLAMTGAGTREPRVNDFVHLDIDDLPPSVRESLTTKVIGLGLGIRGTPLAEDAIRAAARVFHHAHGYLPTASSEEPVPGMKGETWMAINAAGQNGYRGLIEGRTLSIILEPLRKELGLDGILTEEAIRKAAREFFKLHGHLPTCESRESVPGMKDKTWESINAAGRFGYCGLQEGRTLSRIFEPLRVELGIGIDFTEVAILTAASKFYDLHGRLPTAISKEAVPGMEEETWSAINNAGQAGKRGLKKGRTLSKILAPLRQELGLDIVLTEEAILKAGLEYYAMHHRLPTSSSTEQVPGMKRKTWAAVNADGQNGKHGLQKGRTLSQIFAPLRESLGLK